MAIGIASVGSLPNGTTCRPILRGLCRSCDQRMLLAQFREQGTTHRISINYARRREGMTNVSVEGNHNVGGQGRRIHYCAVGTANCGASLAAFLPGRNIPGYPHSLIPSPLLLLPELLHRLSECLARLCSVLFLLRQTWSLKQDIKLSVLEATVPAAKRAVRPAIRCSVITD